MKFALKFFINLVIINFLISCNQNKITKYYPNGNLKSISFLGKDGNDSLYIYHPNQELKQIVYFDDKDTINFTKIYNKEGLKISEGQIVKNKLDFKIGKWKKYGKKVDSIIEYIDLNKNSYVNQVWVLDKSSQDTIKNKGNFYEIKYKKNIMVGDTVEFRFFQYLPFFHYDSDIEVILPKNDDKLLENFSNFSEIETEKFYSLKNDGIPHPEIPNDIPINHYVVFGMIFDKPGPQKLKGYIKEYIENEDIIKEYIGGVDTTTNKLERRQYFNEKFYVKDSIN